jgi:hypothetical protein
VAGAAWEGLVSEALSDGWKSVSSIRNLIRSSQFFERGMYSLMISRNFSSQPFDSESSFICGIVYHSKQDSGHVRLQVQAVTLHRRSELKTPETTS